MSNKIRDFFNSCSVFRREDLFDRFPQYRDKKSALRDLLNYHVKQGHILPVRRHVYAVVPPNCSVENGAYAVDPFALASKLSKDSVIGYHSALAFYGNLHSERYEYIYLTAEHKSKSIFEFAGNRYRSTLVPKALKNEHSEDFEVRKLASINQEVRVTSPERTFVDVLDRPQFLGYDWEEIARSLDKVYLGKPEVLVEYVKLLGSKSTASRVGYFLERVKESAGLQESVIDEVLEYSSRTVAYLDPSQKSNNVLSKKWNLMVPLSLHQSNWEEIY